MVFSISDKLPRLGLPQTMDVMKRMLNIKHQYVNKYEKIQQSEKDFIQIL